MKEVIPFYKEIVFKDNIANLTSISLEHTEKVLDGEVSGEFIIFGDYKIHNDTTEKEDFKYKLPFTALIPDDVDPSSVVVDIADFKYEQIDSDVLRIDIDFSIEGTVIPKLEEERCEGEENTSDLEVIDEDENIDEQIDEILNTCEDDKEAEEVLNNAVEDIVINEADDECRADVIENNEVNHEIELDDKKEVQVIEKVEEKKEIVEEYVTYHVHVVGNTDSVESIIKLYNTNLDILNEYNDIKDLKVGDKVIIPEYLDE